LTSFVHFNFTWLQRQNQVVFYTKDGIVVLAGLLKMSAASPQAPLVKSFSKLWPCNVEVCA